MVSGKVITTIIEMVVAILVLVVLWVVLGKLFPAFGEVSEKLVTKFESFLCDRLGLIAKLTKLKCG